MKSLVSSDVSNEGIHEGITLLSSTDENLLLNAQVAVLQVSFGMALEQSYIFGPPIFLYLHVQGLFLLSILARKVQGFNEVLSPEMSGIPDSRREEYWNWLSAFAFVQLFRRDDDGFHFVPRSLMWISMAAIPLFLLFAVDLSFVRYQSWRITYSHHAVFILDLVFVIWFNSLVFENRLRPLWSNLDPRLIEIISWLAATWNSLWNNLDMWLSSGFRWRRLFRAVVWPFRTWRRLVVGLMILFLSFQVRPPSFDVISVEEIVQEIISDKKGIKEINDDIFPNEITAHGIFEAVMTQKRNRIWHSDDEVTLENYKKRIIDKYERQSKSFNVLDIGPCQWWGLACRYLSVKGLWLISTRPVDVSIPKIDESDEGSSVPIQWSSLNELSLAGRSLRFADFRFAKLQGANLEGAELQGANLDRANLRDADLSRAKMDGTFLSGAELQYARLLKAKLRSANLHKAKLQRAALNEAQLWNANLKKAELQRTDFLKTELQGADMKSADMDGASLWEAKLTCTNLQGARLRGTYFTRAKFLGTDLKDAQLHGAKSREAELLGTNLSKSQLEGVDFYEAKIQNSFGTPESWKLAWLHKVEIYTDEYPMKFFAELSAKLPEVESRIPIFWNHKKDDLQVGDLQVCVNNIPEKATNNGWLSKDALSEGELVVFDGRDVWVPGYWGAWAEWTADLACKNEYTRYSSVKRWNSENPLNGLRGLICPENSGQEQQCDNLDKVKKHILGKLDKATRDDKCPGLRTVPDGGWRISDSD